MGVKEGLTDDVSTNPDAKSADSKVVLNVGGIRHTTWLSTLECAPGE